MSKHNAIAPRGVEEPFDPLSELLLQGAKQLVHQAVDAELHELLRQFEHCRTQDGKVAVVRNGYLPERTLQTGVGAVSVRVPKVRSRTGEPVVFRSLLVPPYVRKTRSLEAALPWLYLKGISTGDMSEALKVLVGPDAAGLSATTVSRLKQRWADEYRCWMQQRLDDARWVYIWADGIYSGLRAENAKLCALVVIGVNERGQKHFLAIEDGVRESTQSWREVLLKRKARGLDAPELGIGDGAMGLWAALEEVFPTTRQQRCWVHKTVNVLNRFPKSGQPKAKQALHEIWQAATKKEAEKGFDLFLKTYEAKVPKATACLRNDRHALLTFYDFPAPHWQSIRTTNPIESSFGTIRHRTRRSKGCLSREGMLHMIFKLGQCAEKKWNRLRGFEALPAVITGVTFKDGIEVTKFNQTAA